MGPSHSLSDSLDELHAVARPETGLSDFGDTAHLENPSCLLRCYDDESRLGAEGRVSTRTTLVNCLKSRLHSNDGFARRKHSVRNRR